MILRLLFPPKCILCRTILQNDETDICHECRKEAPECVKIKNHIPFVAGWTAVWYYKDNVRNSIVRYKFRNARSYAQAYGRQLALRISQQNWEYDAITWVPVSRLRKFKRGYDQVELIAKATANELGVPVMKTLKKIRHNPAQSGLQDVSRRKANVLGVYSVPNPLLIQGASLLLLDDVITTGATCSECARMLLTYGAKEIYCGAIATAQSDKKK